MNKIRENKADDEVLNELNKRYQRDFQPPKEEGYIRLTTHNNQAQRINDRELALPGKAYSFRAEVKDDFPNIPILRMRFSLLRRGRKSCSSRMMFLRKNGIITV